MSEPAATHLMTSTPVAVPEATIDITGPAFARRFANLLADRRVSTKRSLGAMARRGDKRFSRRALRRYEAGEAPLDMVTVSALASLYEVDIDAIVPLRTEIGIDGGGVIAAGGVTARFAPGDPDSLLETYLRLVRRLRDQERAEEVSLRREDVERLAAHLGTSGESVVERLGTLMGATKAQRRVMAGLFLTGAMVITVAVPSVAALSGGGNDPGATLDPGRTGAGTPELVAEPAPTGSDAGQALAEPRSEGSTDAAIGVRSAPVGPGAISIDLLDVDPPAEPVAPAERAADAPIDVDAPTDAADPVDVDTPAEADAPAEPVADPITVADLPPVPQPPQPPGPAPAPATPPEPDNVATGPPPVPEPPSVVVDPAPAPAPPPPAAESPPTPAPEPPPAEAETVAVGPPPVPAPSPPIVDPPTDG